MKPVAMKIIKILKDILEFLEDVYVAFSFNQIFYTL